MAASGRVRTERALNLSRLGKQERQKQQREQSLAHPRSVQPSGSATAMQGSRTDEVILGPASVNIERGCTKKQGGTSIVRAAPSARKATLRALRLHGVISARRAHCTIALRFSMQKLKGVVAVVTVATCHLRAASCAVAGNAVPPAW